MAVSQNCTRINRHSRRTGTTHRDAGHLDDATWTTRQAYDRRTGTMHRNADDDERDEADETASTKATRPTSTGTAPRGRQAR
jgi:hypothetical protein